ncbi:DHH family phosphoesterase [Haloarchaeobius sp. HRN-SO-5]|uniref:DHH family phosphoesterase n=1 Tax=Haloarchaeobius sp. HRN-SO-5 TaxID=3446118 RepID=UPI003EC0A353
MGFDVTPGSISGRAAGVVESATADPLLLLGVVLAVVLGTGAAWFGVRRFRRTPGERFVRAMRGIDEVTVLLHPNPDPDAMACAMATAELCEYAGVEAHLQYPGEIRHQENRAFRTVLDLDLDRIETAADLETNTVVLVDHNTARGFQGAKQVEPYAVVDHHPGNGAGTRHTDIRTDYGACATIFAEYFEGLDAEDGNGNGNGDDDVTLNSKTATGLLYGILSDTNNLTNGCSAAEFDASAYLYPAVNEDLLDRIANPQVPDEVLRTKAKAIVEKDVNGPFAVCDLGSIPNVDAIPQAADELMHLEGVSAVVVFGEQDGTVHMSGRSRDDRIHMGEALRSVVANIPMADAGGHARMGGGQLSKEHMEGIGPSDGVSRDEFKRKLFDALAGARG